MQTAGQTRNYINGPHTRLVHYCMTHQTMMQSLKAILPMVQCFPKVPAVRLKSARDRWSLPTPWARQMRDTDVDLGRAAHRFPTGAHRGIRRGHTWAQQSSNEQAGSCWYPEERGYCTNNYNTIQYPKKTTYISKALGLKFATSCWWARV